jgi:hypothetical protein
MASAAGITIAAGAITAANEVIFAPLAGQGATGFNWRLVPATFLLAAGFSGLEKLSPKLAVGLSTTALVTVLFARVGKAPAPVENVIKALGY